MHVKIPSYLAGPAQNIATDNEGPYLRSSSQGAWMEELRAHQRCAVLFPIHVTPHT